MSPYNKDNPDNNRKKNIVHGADNDLELTVSKTDLFTPEKVQKKPARKPSEEERKQKRQTYKKNKKKNKISSIAVTLLFSAIIVLVLIVNLTQGKYDNQLRTSYIKQGVIENKTSGTAYFLRNEYDIITEHAGKLMPNVSEGERVAVGTVIAYVVSEGMEEYLNELKKTESKISTAQNATGDSEVLLSEDLAVIDKEIVRLNKELASFAMAGDMTSYVGIKRELDALFEQRNDLTMSADTKDAYIKELQNKRNELLEKLRGKMHEVVANYAGVISFTVDGLSEYVTAIELSNITDSHLKELNSESNYMAGKTVTHNDIIARITPDVNYHIAVKVKDSNDFAEGATVLIKARNRKYETDSTVISVDKKSNIVVFQTDHALASSISSRKMDVDCVLQYQEGMKVPLRCLSDWDEAGITARIAILRANFVEFVYVNVLAQNDEYAIISSGSKFDDESTIKVKYNDIYIINYEIVTEGEVVK